MTSASCEAARANIEARFKDRRGLYARADEDSPDGRAARGARGAGAQRFRSFRDDEEPPDGECSMLRFAAQVHRDMA
jgi:hypothetical protein